MVTILEAVVLGIVQGITEWLPVSSSGHLVIFQQLFDIEAPVIFDLMLHIGSLFVVLFVFWKDAKRVLLSIFNDDKDGKKLLLLLIFASIITAIIGFLFEDFFKSLFTSLFAVGIALIVTALLLFSVRWFDKKPKKDMNTLDAFFVGLMQGVAIIPGISRSGSTISTALLRGIDRESAVRFSFLLFIPAVIGATILEFNEFSSINVELLPFVVGTIASMVISYISIKLLIKIIHKQRFYLFGWYCLVVGLTIVLFSVI